MTKELSREELLAILEEKDQELEALKNSAGQTMPDRVLNLINSGHRTIEELASELKTNSRNISSNLTYIRRELKPQGKWLVSSKIDGHTYLKIISLEEFGWI
jgi:arsenate reductase-like glutaredoxin family protein